jgi:hypothetical protein
MSFLCEAEFSTVTVIKTKYHVKSNGGQEMRVAVFDETPCSIQYLPLVRIVVFKNEIKIFSLQFMCTTFFRWLLTLSGWGYRNTFHYIISLGL